MRALLGLLVVGAVLLACAPAQGTPVWGYRLVDDRTLSILASTAEGFETWIAGVEETSTTVVVSVHTRRTGYGAGAFPAQDLWLTVKLDAPLGQRAVLDAIGNSPVEVAP